MHLDDQHEPGIPPATAGRCAPAPTQVRRPVGPGPSISHVRAELALLERAGSQPLTVARRRSQALGAVRRVTPVRPLERSLRIVHLGAAPGRLVAAPGRRPWIVR